MALPASGQLAASAINRELRRAASSTLSIDSAENGGYAPINRNSASRPNSANPAAFSEWYGYNHSASGGGGGPRVFTLIEIGFDRTNRDTACRNAAIGRYTQVWGDGPSLQDCNNLYSNGRGTAFAAEGWYAENFTQFERFWNGFDFTTSRECRI